MKLQSKIIFTLSFLIILFDSTLEISKKKFLKNKSQKSKQFLKGKTPILSDLIVEKATYKTPVTTEFLSGGNYPDYYDGKIEDANVHYSNEIYYNGKDHLNALVVECKQMTMFPSRCMKNKFCGWCQESQSCIPGTPKGPMIKCKGIFDFTNPNTPFNPFTAGDVNLYIEKGGKPSIVKTATPDMKKFKLIPYLG